jgi:hypothetical protein
VRRRKRWKVDREQFAVGGRAPAKRADRRPRTAANYGHHDGSGHEEPLQRVHPPVARLARGGVADGGDGMRYGTHSGMGRLEQYEQEKRRRAKNSPGKVLARGGVADRRPRFQEGGELATPTDSILTLKASSRIVGANPINPMFLPPTAGPPPGTPNDPSAGRDVFEALSKTLPPPIPRNATAVAPSQGGLAGALGYSDVPTADPEKADRVVRQHNEDLGKFQDWVNRSLQEQNRQLDQQGKKGTPMYAAGGAVHVTDHLHLHTHLHRHHHVGDEGPDGDDVYPRHLAEGGGVGGLLAMIEASKHHHSKQHEQDECEDGGD